MHYFRKMHNVHILPTADFNTACTIDELAGILIFNTAQFACGYICRMK